MKLKKKCSKPTEKKERLSQKEILELELMGELRHSKIQLVKENVCTLQPWTELVFRICLGIRKK